MRKSRFALLLSVLFMTCGLPGTTRADESSEPSRMLQQNLMLSLAVYDIQINQQDAHFRLGSGYDTNAEREEIRQFNRSLILAISSERASVLDGVLATLPKDIRQIIKEDLAANDWDNICEKCASFAEDSFEHPIGDTHAARAVFLLAGVRLYEIRPAEAAVALGLLYVDRDTATDIRDGNRAPITCDEIWALKAGANLIESSNKAVAESRCEGLRRLAQCIVDLETRISEILPAAVRNGSKIDDSWRAYFLDEEGAFIPVLSKEAIAN